MKSELCALVILALVAFATGYTKLNAQPLTSPYIYPRLPIVQPMTRPVYNSFLPQYNQFHAQSVLPYPGNLHHVVPQQPIIRVPAQHPGVFHNMASRLFPAPVVPHYQAYGGNLLYGQDSKTVTKSVLYSLILNQLANRFG